MMIALAAVWITITGPPPSMMAAIMASATTRATCHGPLPIRVTRASPTNTPSTTPSTSSSRRRTRWVWATATVITATIGANTTDWRCR